MASLKELEPKIRAQREKVKAFTDEAGGFDVLDLTLVKSVEGDEKVKLETFQKWYKELEDLETEARPLRAAAKAMQDNEEEVKEMNRPVNRLPTPGLSVTPWERL